MESHIGNIGRASAHAGRYIPSVVSDSIRQVSGLLFCPVPILKVLARGRESLMSKWQENPDSAGHWWYYGDQGNSGIVSEFEVRGILKVIQKNDGLYAINQDGREIGIQSYKGVWCRCEPPKLPGQA